MSSLHSILSCLSPRHPDATGATALVLAIRSGNADVVRALLDAGMSLSFYLVS